MPTNGESPGWLAEAVGALSLGSAGLGGWILRTASRQGRLEEKVDGLGAAMEVDRENEGKRLDKIEDGIRRIHKHLTGIDL